MTDYTKTTGNKTADAWLGFIGLGMLILFFWWGIGGFADPEETERQQERIENAREIDEQMRQVYRDACARGVQRGCDALNER
jgi:hypothetical protein